MPYLSTEKDLFILLYVYYSLHFVLALFPVCGCAPCAVLTVFYIIYNEKQNPPPLCFQFSTLYSNENNIPPCGFCALCKICTVQKYCAKICAEKSIDRLSPVCYPKHVSRTTQYVVRGGQPRLTEAQAERRIAEA